MNNEKNIEKLELDINNNKYKKIENNKIINVSSDLNNIYVNDKEYVVYHKMIDNKLYIKSNENCHSYNDNKKSIIIDNYNGKVNKCQYFDPSYSKTIINNYDDTSDNIFDDISDNVSNDMSNVSNDISNDISDVSNDISNDIFDNTSDNLSNDDMMSDDFFYFESDHQDHQEYSIDHDKCHNKNEILNQIFLSNDNTINNCQSNSNSDNTIQSFFECFNEEKCVNNVIACCGNEKFGFQKKGDSVEVVSSYLFDKDPHFLEDSNSDPFDKFDKYDKCDKFDTDFYDDVDKIKHKKQKNFERIGAIAFSTVVMMGTAWIKYLN